MAKAKAKKKPAIKAVDFYDMDAVKLAMAKALAVDADDVEIEEDSGGLGSFGQTVYRVKAGHEYLVVRDDDVFEELALAVVTQDLESEPMKPGGMKTLAGIACVGGGSILAFKTGSKVIRSLSIGTAAGGLWSLIMRG